VIITDPSIDAPRVTSTLVQAKIGAAAMNIAAETRNIEETRNEIQEHPKLNRWLCMVFLSW